jgi:hypothetical protein
LTLPAQERSEVMRMLVEANHAHSRAPRDTG